MLELYCSYTEKPPAPSAPQVLAQLQKRASSRKIVEQLRSSSGGTPGAAVEGGGSSRVSAKGSSHHGAGGGRNGSDGTPRKSKGRRGGYGDGEEVVRGIETDEAAQARDAAAEAEAEAELVSGYVVSGHM